jgi:hypothetical protein
MMDMPGASTSSGVSSAGDTVSGVTTASGLGPVPGELGSDSGMYSGSTVVTRTDGGEELTKVADDPRLGSEPLKGKIILGGAVARPQENTPPPRKRASIELGLGAAAPLPQEHKAEELIIARDPVAALQGLDRQQLNELALVGHKLFERGKVAQARAVFEALVAIGISDAFPYTMLGTVYLAQGNPSRALALFEAALRMDAKDVAARVYRGEIKAQTGKHKEALSDFDQVVRQGKKEDPFVQRARQLSRITADLAKKRR